MTIREWIAKNGIDAIVYDTHANKYLFEYRNEEDGLWYEGDIVKNHKDFEMILDYEILRIDYDLNDKPTLEVFIEFEDEEEEINDDSFAKDDIYKLNGFGSEAGFWKWKEGIVR